jgi:hypothetical protein
MTTMARTSMLTWRLKAAGLTNPRRRHKDAAEAADNGADGEGHELVFGGIDTHGAGDVLVLADGFPGPANAESAGGP